MSQKRRKQRVYRPRSLRNSFRPIVEQMEDRLVPANFTVNTALDTVAVMPSDGTGQDADGNISLRSAIMAANAFGDASNTISIPDSLNPTLTIVPAGSDDDSSGDLNISVNLNIQSASGDPTMVTIDAGGAAGINDRVFRIEGASAITVTITGVTITGGDLPGSSAIINDPAAGGGIEVSNTSATLQLNNDVVTGNTANGDTSAGSNPDGGGIFNNGTLAVVGGSISGNTATITDTGSAYARAQGGGIFNNGSLSLSSGVSVTNNTANATGNTGSALATGGGIVNTNTGTAAITGGSITSNTASTTTAGGYSLSQAGGIFNNGSTLTLTGVSINGNHVTATNTAGSYRSTVAEGGGLFNESSGTVNVMGGSISNNVASTTATSTTGGFFSSQAHGGGMFNRGHLSLSNVTNNSNQATATNTVNSTTSASTRPEARGAGLYNDTTGNATISGGSVNSNQATATGTSTALGNGSFGAYASGGGVYSQGTLSLSSTSVNSNTVTATPTAMISAGGSSFSASATATATGGGLRTQNGTVTLTNVLVNNNTATATPVAMTSGGNYASAGATAEAQGGGLYNTATVTVIGGSFSTNTVTTTGTFASAPDATNSSTGSAYASGGGIFNSNRLSLSNVSVDHNQATGIATATSARSTGVSIPSYGGGIENNSILNLTNVTVNNNTASATPSATVTGGGSYSANGLVGVRGGGLRSNGSATIIGGTISNNTVTASGTFAAAPNATNNSSTGSAYGSGGGAYSNGSLSMTNTPVTGNTVSTVFTATGSAYVNVSDTAVGGGLIGHGQVALDNVTISNNTVTASPTAISSSATRSATANVNNAATGGIGLGAGSHTIMGGSISNNTVTATPVATNTGGGPRSTQSNVFGAGLSDGGQLTLDNTPVTGNSSTGGGDYSRGDGGGVYVTGTATIIGGAISNNSLTLTAPVATGGGYRRTLGLGGGLFSSNQLTLNNVAVSGNSATATATTTDTSTASAEVRGAGVFLNGSATFIGSTVTGSTASATSSSGDYGLAVATGGGVYSNAQTTLSSGSSVGNNTATSTAGGSNRARSRAMGGGISSQGGTLTLTGASFSTNSASAMATSTGSSGAYAISHGGNLSNSGNATVLGGTLDAGTATSTAVNTAGGYGQTLSTGGGVYNSGTLTINGTAVTGSHATASATGGTAGYAQANARGGAIANQNNATIIGGVLTGNTASATGTGNSSANAGVAATGGGFYNHNIATLIGSVIGATGAGNSTTATATNNGTGPANASSTGGGVYNNNQLTTSGGTTVSSNSASASATAPGGGIASAGSDGGGLYNINTATIFDTTFKSNQAGDGGGVWSNSSLQVSNSTINANQAPGNGVNLGDGGGLLVQGQATATNVTIDGNTAAHDGGGIIVTAGGNLSLVSDTVSSNAATASGGVFVGAGSTLQLVNTIIALSTAGGDVGNAGTITSSGHNLIQATADPALTGDATNIIGQDPQLGPLQNNRGPTFTRAIAPTSPALDAGDDAQAPPTDQRGVKRPQGPHSDIGAFELEIADLSINKSDNVGGTSGPPPVTGTAVSGSGITYTITVHNGGTSDVTGAGVTDTFSSKLTNISWTATATAGSSVAAASGTGNINTTVDLLSGGTATYTVTATIDSSATGTLSNTANVTAPTAVFDPNLGNNSATDTDNLTGISDLSITKSDSAGGSSVGPVVGSAVPGTAITYTITVHNAGPSAEAGATVADTFVASLTNVHWTSTASAGSSTGAASGTGNINTTADLLAGGTATFTVTADIDPTATGTLTNTATVTAPSGTTDPDTSNNSATDTDTLVPTANLSITKTDNVTSVTPGTSDIYTIVVSNAGQSTATAAPVTDNFPAAFTNATWTATASTGSSSSATSGTGNIATTVTIPSGGSVTYIVHGIVDPAATGTLSNTATVAAPAGVTDPDTSNNSATDTDTLTPTADLSIVKDDGSATAIPGTPNTYTIVVTNVGPSAVSGATVTDNFPASLMGVTWTATASPGSSVSAGSGTGNISTTVNLAPGGQVTFSATGMIDPTLTGSLSNTATVAAPAGVTDPVSSNNSSTDTDTLTPIANLGIAKTDSSTTAVPGTSTTYTIIVANGGPSAVTTAPVTDNVPVTLTNVSWTATATTGSSSSASSGTGSINTTVNLLPGGTVTYHLTGTIDPSATGSLSNTATVGVPSGVTDPDTSNNSATDTDTLTPVANLSITKTDGAASAVPGTSITYTIVVTDQGPSSVTNAAVADTFAPALFSNVMWTAVASPGSSVTASAGNGDIGTTVSLLPAGTVTFTVTADIDQSLTGTLSNTATVTAPAGVTDPDTTNNSATDTDTLTPRADLSITKTDGVTTAVPGTPLTYTIVVTNAGPSAVTAAPVTDNLPAALTGVSWTAVPTAGSSVAMTSGSGNINTTVSLLSAGTVTFTVMATIDPTATGMLTNTAHVEAPTGVTDPTPSNNTATDTDTLTPTANLSINKTDGATTAIPGNSITYTITVTNVGPSAVNRASVLDTLPAALLNASWTAVATSGSNSGSPSGNGSINTAVDLLPGGSVTFTLQATIDPSATGTLNNTATVTAPAGVNDPAPGNNSSTDSDTLNPTANLSITKTDGVTSAVPGTSDTYTIVVSNAGPSAVTAATVTDMFPAALTGVTWTTTASTGSSVAAGSGSGNISTTVDLLPGGSVTFTATGTIDPSATGTLDNTASVGVPAGVTDPNNANNSATDSDMLTPTANLAITKTDNATTAVPGTPITYIITVSNAGPSAVTAAPVTDHFVALTNVSWSATASTGSSSSPASGTGDIGTTVNLLPNGTVTYTVTATVDPSATGTLSNTASVAAPDGVTDPDTSNNSATDSNTLTPRANLAITKTDGVASAVPGTDVTYTITVGNHGPSAVTAAPVADNFPATLTNVHWTATPSSGASVASASGTGNIGTTVSLLPGSTVTFSATGTIDSTATGTLSNTANVAAPAGVIDPDLSNNSAIDVDALTPQADLSITKDDGVTSATPGTPIVYTIVAHNAGPSAVTGAVVTDMIPSDLIGATWTVTTSAGSSSAAAGGTGDINDSLNLLVNGTATFMLTATIDPSATGSLSNTARIDAPFGVGDPTPGNNSATDTDTLTSTANIANLAITKTDSSTTAVPGTTITYTIVVSNFGPAAAPGATVTDNFPVTLSNVTWTCSASVGSSCATPSGTGDIITTVDLAPNGNVTFIATGTIDPSATGMLSNIASVAAPVGITDPDLTNNSSTDTDTLTPTANLSISKTDGVASAVPGTSDTYTIVVTNHGPSAVTDAPVNDNFPTAFTNVHWTATPSSGSTVGAASGAGNIGTTVSLPPGGTVTFSATGTIDPAATGTLSNTASVDAPAGVTDPDTTNNSATDTDALTPRVDLSITKSDGVTSVVPGNSLTYTIVVSNAGPSDVTGATVTDSFPASLTGVSWTATATTGSSVAAGSGTGDINTTVDLASGGMVTFTVTADVDPSATGTLSNTARVDAPSSATDTDLTNNSATDTDTLTPIANLGITKSDNHGGNSVGPVTGSAVPGTAITYTITVSNTGPSAVSGATVKDTFPASLANVNWSVVTSSGSSSSSASGSGNIDTLVNLLPSGTATFTVTANIDPSATGTLANTATVSTPAGVTDPVAGNNTATVDDMLTPQADLGITKTDGVTSAVPGTSVTYTIVVNNTGPSAVSGATVTDNFPAAIASASWSVVTTAGSSAGAVSGSGNIATTVNLLPGGHATFTVDAMISPSATGSLANMASVGVPAGVTDNNTGNNVATDTDSLTPNANLGITKSDGVASAVPGASNTYTIVVSNAGPSAVTGATVTDNFPAAFTNVSWTAVATAGSSSTATSGNGNIGTTVSLLPNGSVTFTATGTISATATGTLANSASVAAPAGVTDPDNSNNSATDTDTLTPTADLSITKTDNVVTVAPGAANTYTIVVTNQGPSAVTGATVTDNFPANLTNVSWTAVATAGSSSAATSGNGNIATTVDLAVHGSVTFTVTTTVSSSAVGSVTNTASVAAPAGVTDSDGSNNSATDSDTVLSAAASQISGTVFLDVNADGTQNTGEAALQGRTIFLDTNNNGVLDQGETSTVTNANGNYGFGGLAAGTYHVRETTFPGTTITVPASGSYTVTAVAGSNSVNQNFGNVLYSPVVPVVVNAVIFPHSPDADTAYIRGLYHSLLNRDADPAGLNAWLSSLHGPGGSRSKVAAGIWETPEHRGLQVDSYYLTFLQRPSDPGGRAFWQTMFQQGRTENQVVIDFTQTPEFQAHHPSDAEFVAALYTDILGRQGDISGIGFWQTILKTGTSRPALVQNFILSPESVTRVLDGYYAGYLHIATDSDRPALTNALLAGVSFEAIGVDFFLASDKYFAGAMGAVP
jgi:uncharacterized repeat protein (TIGR01451 family)